MAGIAHMHSPKYWRMRAEEFRSKADNCEIEESKQSLRNVANNYEELARQAEALEDVKK